MPSNVTEKLLRAYDIKRMFAALSSLMEGWQYKGAFVIQFRKETNIEARLFEGKVEHVASHESVRFHSLDELLSFIAKVLTEVNNREQ